MVTFLREAFCDVEVEIVVVDKVPSVKVESAVTRSRPYVRVFRFLRFVSSRSFGYVRLLHYSINLFFRL